MESILDEIRVMIKDEVKGILNEEIQSKLEENSMFREDIVEIIDNIKKDNKIEFYKIHNKLDTNIYNINSLYNKCEIYDKEMDNIEKNTEKLNGIVLDNVKTFSRYGKELGKIHNKVFGEKPKIFNENPSIKIFNEKEIITKIESINSFFSMFKNRGSDNIIGYYEFNLLFNNNTDLKFKIGEKDIILNKTSYIKLLVPDNFEIIERFIKNMRSASRNIFLYGNVKPEYTYFGDSYFSMNLDNSIKIKCDEPIFMDVYTKFNFQAKSGPDFQEFYNNYYCPYNSFMCKYTER